LLGRIGKTKAALITEEVPCSTDLYEIVKHNPEKFKNKSWRCRVLDLLAEYLSKLHKKHFVHSDLNWRNILISEKRKEPEVYFFDMPLARRRFDFSFKHFVLKDLAMLDRVAREVLSRTDRMRFYLKYCARRTLTAQDKTHIAKIQAYIDKKQRENPA